MIFVEFTCQYGGREYFVGRDLQSVLQDTHGGKSFGGEEFSSYREISKDEARQLRLEFLESGIEAIKFGSSLSYKLRTPPLLREKFEKGARKVSKVRVLANIFVTYTHDEGDARNMLSALLAKLPRDASVIRQELEACLPVLRDLEKEVQEETERLDWRPNS